MFDGEHCKNAAQNGIEIDFKRFPQIVSLCKGLLTHPTPSLPGCFKHEW